MRNRIPLYAARGQGCRVWDVDGVERIDCINNFTAAIHGYAHPALVRAACAQLDLGTAFGLPTQSEIDLAELLVTRVKSVEQCRFANSGTEAVMSALKAARAYTGRAKIAKCEGAYHGSYDYAEVSLDSARRSVSDSQFDSVPYAAGTPAGVLNDVVVLPFNDVDKRCKSCELTAMSSPPSWWIPCPIGQVWCRPIRPTYRHFARLPPRSERY
jgi:glutamate-1-semialdehyde 2,1-aminomutase